MKYYILIFYHGTFDIQEYLVKCDKSAGICMCQVTDENYRDFIVKSGLIKSLTDGFFMTGVGEDKHTYRFTMDGIQMEGNKKRSPEIIWGMSRLFIRFSFHRFLKNLSKNREPSVCKKATSKINDGYCPFGKTLSPFKKFVYVHNEDKAVIPFRLRLAKNEQQPLVVYFGGAGTLGCDNFKTFFEFLHDANGKKVAVKDCNILIPQKMHSFLNTTSQDIPLYADYCALLINALSENCKMNKDRIYLYGVSHGAMIIWQSVLRHPELYAAAIPSMGMLPDYRETDVSPIKDVHIWIAHSSDDRGVPIDSDDYCYEKLQALGADVNYSRWDKYGHRMSSKFFKNEPWAEWMFSKSKNPTA